MTAVPPRAQTCPNCKRTFSRKKGPGRPKEYCSSACRSAARRKEPPDAAAMAAAHQETIIEVAESVLAVAHRLKASACSGEDSKALLELRMRLDRELENFEAAVVQRGRGRAEPWEALAHDLPVSAERLRKRWSAEVLQRRFGNRRPRPADPLPRQTPSAIVPRQRDDENLALPLPPQPGPNDVDDEGGRPGLRPPQQQLAEALSFLQRQHGRPLRELAAYAHINPSYVSRVLSGNRRPSWPVTAGLVEACGEDPAVFQPLWRLAHGHQIDIRVTTTEQAVTEFHRFLRSLHFAAALPEPGDIAAASDRYLATTDVERTLNTRHVPTWPITARLVAALRARPDSIRPLWNAARTLPSATAPRHSPLLLESF